MAIFDLPLDELRVYRPTPEMPADFTAFWRRTLDETSSHPLDAQFTAYDAALPRLDVFDVRFAGWGGDPVAAWLLIPHDGGDQVPCVIHYIGYGNGRSFPHDHTMWAAAGWAVLVVDTRGVSGVAGKPGSTPDPYPASAPHVPGFVTQGLDHPEHYYYRRVFTDAVRAVQTARTAPRIDGSRLVLNGGSQGGATAQATAVLTDLLDEPVLAALIDMPFMTHIRRAADLSDAGPYPELVQYLATHREAVDQAFATLAYFDGLNMATRGRTPALYSVALRDPVCPPSTVFAAYNTWSGPKEIVVWPFNGHEGGGTHQITRQLRYLRALSEPGADAAATLAEATRAD